MPPQDPYRYFRIEARELLDQLSKAVLDLEKGPDPELVARLLRLAHTLKGAARVVKQLAIAECSHGIEEVLAPFRDTQAAIPRDRIEAVLALLDVIAGRLATLIAPATAAADVPEIPSGEPTGAVRADLEEVDELIEGIAEVHARLGSLRQGFAAIERAHHLAGLIADQAGTQRHWNSQAGTSAARARIQTLGAELVTVFTGFGREVASDLGHLDRELALVRDTAQRLRLAPASSIFTALERTARDTARALDKRIDFVCSGGEVRLDPQVLVALQGALLQVVRNAVAHGIEPETDRVAAGKPPAGRISITVLRRGREIVFTGSDDGCGVDLEAVRSAAQHRGLPATAAMGQDRLLGLLLAGGISTASTVTELAGRGIGLDVVRAAAERLGSGVHVRTVLGKGTDIELAVPISQAAIDALMVEAGGVQAAIPREAVLHTMRVAAHDIIRTADGESVLHARAVIPFLPLACAWSTQPSPMRGQRPWSMVVVRAGGRTAAIGVDRLLGMASLVFRPLPGLVLADPVVAGTWLDAEGNPQLMLDPDVLTVVAGRPAAVTGGQLELISILVVDDSLTSRMLEQSILESAGYAVDTAVSGEDALEKVQHKRYALVLVDVDMPGMDGFAFIGRLRADPVLHAVPAILVTSRSSPEDRRLGELAGADAYIVKSAFDQGLLLGHIRSLLAAASRGETRVHPGLRPEHSGTGLRS